MRTLDEIFKNVSTVGIGGHVHPDGDCIGSCLGMLTFIREQYPQIEADLYLEPVPACFHFLANADAVISDCRTSKKYDLFLALDCGDASRLGKAEKIFRAAERTFCVDHHKTNVGFADENYIEPEASSTCELIYLLTQEKGISKAAAECLYTGIAHDTGIFQYSNTSPRTMNIAGELMSFGIDHTAIINDTYYEKTMKQNQVLGYLLLKAKQYLGDTCVISWMDRAELDRFAAGPQEMEGVVSSLRSTKGAEVGVLFYETNPNTFKVSLRSKSGRVDVSRIAVKYGGGGHAKASGATIGRTTPEQILQNLLADLKEQLEPGAESCKKVSGADNV